MDDAKTPNRWVKSLDQAGLLDDIEDGWALPDDATTPGASIQVDGAGGRSIPPFSEDPVPVSDSQPMLLQQGTVDVAIVDDVPRTPVERHRSSQPGAASEPRASEPHIKLTSARSTQSGLPRPSWLPPPAEPQKREEPEHAEPAGERPARRVTAPRRSPAREERPAADSEPPRWELVRKSKARVTVPPADERVSRSDTLEPIVDMPPDERRPRRRTSKAPRAISASDHLRTQMRERLEIGDYSGALAAAEEMAKSGDEDPEVERLREECRRVLVGMYESRIGSFHRAPVVAVSPHELVWRSLDATAGFILSRIDGTSTFEDIVDISGLPRFETCRILNQLLQDGIIR